MSTINNNDLNIKTTETDKTSKRGKIIKGIGGFYYVNVTDDKLYECKARGVFRNRKEKPLVGDDVEIEIIDPEKAIGNIVSILPRKNALIRPAVANCDQVVIFFALANPKPNINLLDRFLILMDKQDVETMICFNKADIEGVDAEYYRKLYELSGYKVFITSTEEGTGVDEFISSLEGKTTVLAGPSGVGKSSMLNKLLKTDYAETGEISEKIKRGKHTTRHSELIYVSGETYVMDTPGFTSLEVFDIEEKELKYYFKDFTEFNDSCRFTGCVHINEPDCEVKQAIKDGKIAKERYDNYIQIYEELKSRRKW